MLPSLICGLTLAGRRWGPSVAGWLSGLPIVAGPILFFVSVEQGPEFGAAAAQGTLSGLIPVLAFISCYAWVATRKSWMISVAAGWCAYAITVVVMYLLSPSLMVSTLVDLAALWYMPRWLPKVGAPALTATLSYSEIGVRMLAGVALLLVLTNFASGLGPRLSGLLAMFPTLGTVLAVFSHRHAGAEFAIHLLRGMVLGLYAFLAFTVVLAWSLTSLHIGTAFVLAIIAALLVQGGARILAGVALRRV